MNYISSSNNARTTKNKISLDKETNSNNKDKKIIADQVATRPFLREDNFGNAFFESKPRPFTLISPGAFNSRGLDMSFFAPQTTTNKPNNLEMNIRLMRFFENCRGCNFIAQNSSFDETAFIDSSFENCLLNVYQHKFNQNVLTDFQNITKAIALTDDIFLYNEKTKQHSLAQEFISSRFLTDQQRNELSIYGRHDARYDTEELIKIYQELIKINPDLDTYIDKFYCFYEKNKLLNCKIYLEPDWHYTRGVKARIILLFDHHPYYGKNWMTKVPIDPDYLTANPPEIVPELVKKNMKPKNFKTTSLSFIWPIGSKEFEIHCPNCSKADIERIYNQLNCDREFWELVKKLLKKEDKRRHRDIYEFKYDGPISNHDKAISLSFHRVAPTQKMRVAEAFNDPRLLQNAKKIMLYYYSDYLDQKTKKLVLTHEIDELFDEGSSKVTFKDCHKDFEELQKKKLPQEKTQRLEEYSEYLKKLEDKPEIMLGD